MGSFDQTPASESWCPVYFAHSLPEAEYIRGYLGSAQIESICEPDADYADCYWVLVQADSVRNALRVLADEREGELDEEGMQRIREAMSFSSSQLMVIAGWSLLILALVVLVALLTKR